MVGTSASLWDCTIFHLTCWHNSSHNKHGMVILNKNMNKETKNSKPYIDIIIFSVVQQPGLNVITELIIGYLYPGKPLANVCFKTYGYISMGQALFLTQDLKLGHYMKIPPKSMFIVQVIIKYI